MMEEKNWNFVCVWTLMSQANLTSQFMNSDTNQKFC